MITKPIIRRMEQSPLFEKDPELITRYRDLFRRACDFAEDYYAKIVHPTGESYIQYALNVAELLLELGSDPVLICSAILIPPLSVEGNFRDAIRNKFKGEVDLLELVDEVLYLDHLESGVWPVIINKGVSSELKEQREILRKMFRLAIDDIEYSNNQQDSLASIHFQKKEKQIENLIRMFLASSVDVRAVIIKLADHLHFIKLLKDLPLIRESMDYILLAKIILVIYAPLADRLGIWRLKSELEDAAFYLLDPVMYKRIANQLSKKQDREKHIEEIKRSVRVQLEAFGITSEISGRAKHIYSIYQKMRAKQLNFDQINDLLGIRIIVNEKDCYLAQSIIHEYWTPMTNFYDGKLGRDWIAKPKDNQYQSLHTTIQVKNKIVEIQIRTSKMDEVAEYGIAAEHWRYKESKVYKSGKTPQVAKKKDQTWSTQLSQLRMNLVNANSVSSFARKGFLKDQIFVITPEGHVIDLPAGATPLDFAYRIHTSLGHSYAGAKVGDHLVRLDYKLKNGDIVKLIISRTRTRPSSEWLSKRQDDDGKSDYVFARTKQARSKIRNWLNHHDPNIQMR